MSHERLSSFHSCCGLVPGSEWPGDGSSGTSPQKPCDTSKRLFEEREKSVCCQQSPKSPKVLKREHVANLYNRYKEHMV